jgi:glutamate-1-semialdehyde 2,1-aminomutase
MTQKLCQGLEHIASTHQLPFVTQQIGSMFGMFFGVNTPPTDFDEVCSCNIEHYKTFHASMLSQGFYFAPSAYETAFMNTCINDSHINKTLDAANIAMKKISQL